VVGTSTRNVSNVRSSTAATMRNVRAVNPYRLGVIHCTSMQNRGNVEILGEKIRGTAIKSYNINYLLYRVQSK